jgi:hypothetical protein
MITFAVYSFRIADNIDVANQCSCVLHTETEDHNICLFKLQLQLGLVPGLPYKDTR